MRKIVGLFALLGVLLLLGPAVSTGQQKKDNPKKDDVTKEETSLQDYGNLAQVKEIVGKIAELDSKASSLTFRIEWSHMEPNANAAGNQKLLQQQQQLMTRYYKIMAMKNSLQQQQQMAQFQAQLQQFQAAGNANLANMFRVVKSSKEYELGVMDNVRVARVKLEEKYTEEGELIKYTKEEIKKMKSADMPEAYIAQFEDLKPGFAVKLYLSPPKKQDTKKSSDSTEEKKTTSSTLTTRPRVRMVLILDDSSPPEAQEPPKKKKGG